MNLIKQKMIEKNITQDELGDLLNLSQPSISNLCNGNFKSLKLRTALALSKILGVSVDEIYLSASRTHANDNEEYLPPAA